MPAFIEPLPRGTGNAVVVCHKARWALVQDDELRRNILLLAREFFPLEHWLALREGDRLVYWRVDDRYHPGKNLALDATWSATAPTLPTNPEDRHAVRLGRIVGVLPDRRLCFIRDLATGREILCHARAVIPASDWSMLTVGTLVSFCADYDRLHPGLFRAVVVQRGNAEEIHAGLPGVLVAAADPPVEDGQKATKSEETTSAAGVGGGCGIEPGFRWRADLPRPVGEQGNGLAELPRGHRARVGEPLPRALENAAG
ncbi:MAG: hypothetical protein ACM3X6_06425 [Patescibacteria group bacterium]